MTEPVKCRACGKKAEVKGDKVVDYWIACSCEGCWTGPYGKTKEGAINAWNKVMEVK